MLPPELSLDLLKDCRSACWCNGDALLVLAYPPKDEFWDEFLGEYPPLNWFLGEYPSCDEFADEYKFCGEWVGEYLPCGKFTEGYLCCDEYIPRGELAGENLGEDCARENIGEFIGVENIPANPLWGYPFPGELMDAANDRMQ